MLQKVKAILRSKNYRLYSRPYELNIVGVRSKSVIPNRFDDQLHVFYRTSGLHWEYHIFQITTDPGTYWLKNPMQPQGTAILEQGQYVNAYVLGKHRGQYTALVQHKAVTVIRDYDRNALLDFNNGKRTTGHYGINIHRASANGKTRSIDKYSAGCQVFENVNDFAAFMKLCEKHHQLYGNQFTYTLIDFRAMQRQSLRWAGYATAIAGTVGVAAYFLLTYNKKETKHELPTATIKRQVRTLQPA